VQELGRECRGDELVVNALVDDLFELICRIAVLADAYRGPRVAKDGVNLVEAEPVPDEMPKALEAHPGVTHEEVDDLTITPSVIVVRKIEGLLVVMQGDKRLNAPLPEVGEQTFIERDTLLVGFFLRARGEQTCPLNREAQRLKSHLGKEVDVLLVAVIEVDAMATRILV